MALLEQTRGLHEDVERLERLIVKDYQNEAKTYREKLMQNHRVRKRIDDLQEASRKLLHIYEDDDGSRREEIADLGAASQAALYTKFYERLKDIKDVYKRFPSTEITEAEDDSHLLREEPHVDFSGEEAMGRYLDLHELHRAWANAKFGSQETDYLTYIGTFAQLASIPKPQRLTKPYRDYLQQLLDYLAGFYERTQPLGLLGKQFDKLEEELREAWPQAALLEAKVVRLGELLANVVSDTKGRAEKKQAQTYEELQAELEEGDPDALDLDSDEEEYVYNPLKLPLGWDGKPIPYWLYKLHGLNQELKCEICGNYSYWGRRAFERHFKEWRHANGMKSLGIPNTKEFFEVTKIEDAQSLWKNLQSRNVGGFNPEVDEELEDADGNVYNRKTYEDLRRQGLL